MQGEAIEDRSILEITGPERVHFLQGLVTNDLKGLKTGAVYAALLSPQGKYLADFFLVVRGETILLDAAAAQAPDLLKRLSLYKLRSKVEIAESPLHVARGTGPAPEGAVADPRHPALGWRLYGDTEGGPEVTDWAALRVEHCVPEAGVELIPNDSYILECGFERLHGVDFRKGCYVGQEVTARMKHKTELRKGLAPVAVDGAAAPGTEITREGKAVGTLHTVAGGRGIAYLRFDRAGEGMTAGDARLSPLPAPA